MTHPNLIAVEGPNAIGKGYFIHSLNQHLTNYHTEVIKTTDHVFLSKDLRNYSTNFIQSNPALKELLIKHIAFLSYLEEKLLTHKNANTPSVIILDRCYTSFLNYNYIPAAINIVSPIPQIEEERMELRLLNKDYQRRITKLSKDFYTLHVTLKIPEEDKPLETLQTRLLARNENKPINRKWLEYLLSIYSQCSTPTGYTSSIFTTSSNHLLFKNKYFQH